MFRSAYGAPLLAVLVAVVVRLLREIRVSLGGRVADINRRTAISPRCMDGRFINVEPTEVVSEDASWPSIVAGFVRRAIDGGPPFPVPLGVPDYGDGSSALAVTWFGHASALVEVDGYKVLTDPMWSKYVAPTQLFGLRRFHPPPIPLSMLPVLDAIVVSHDHFDHLDPATVRSLTRLSRAPFVVPLGVGAHLEAWGVPIGRIVELDWWQAITVGRLRITCTPARHYSGRTVLSNNTLWSSWSLIGPTRAAFFAGDTGPTALHSEIADRLGPFDLTLVPIGAYDDAWPDIHLNPPQALAAHGTLGKAGSTLLPIHWATFPLAPHPWSEPIEWLLRDASDACSIIAPAPGQRVPLSDINTVGSPIVEWWNPNRSDRREVQCRPMQ